MCTPKHQLTQHPMPRMLHRITGRATKCGPCVMSAITGMPTHEAARIMRELSGLPCINGVEPFLLSWALETAGFTVEEDPATQQDRLDRHAKGTPLPTLSVWLKTLATPGTYAVCSRNHWIAVAVDDGPRREGEWADSGFMAHMRKPRHLAEAPFRLRVARAIRVQ